MKLSRLQLADIEKALDSMAVKLKEHDLLKHPEAGAYLRAIRLVRDLPPGHRRMRSDFNCAWAPAAQKRIEIE